MIFKFKTLTVTALVLCVCFIAGISVVNSPQYLFANTTVSARQQIILDAGHGGLTNTTD